MSALSDLAHGQPAERLVPGDPEGVDGLGRTLSAYGDLLADAARALGRIEVDWAGDAANRFRDEFGLQPERFTAAAKAFVSASTALARYASTLDSAQLAAEQARELFAAGMRSAAAVEGGLLGGAENLSVLTSPAGREQRLAAVELLERVRDDVERCGNETAETVRTAMAAAPEPVSAWQHAWNFFLAAPWELNQERRDWAAGAAVGMLDTVVLASNPLPIALWVGASVKPQVNALEWRLGVNPRGGFHTAGAVVVPSILTGSGVVSTAQPARVGITFTELEGKASDSINLFRGMRAAPDGLPELGPSAKTLGVRPNNDIPVVNGSVDPHTGGMSVNDSIDSLPHFRKPPEFGGMDKTLKVYSIRSDEFGQGLTVVPDRDGHNTVQPSMKMNFEEYVSLLNESRDRWTVVNPR